jgi:hypothetical protein
MLTLIALTALCASPGQPQAQLDTTQNFSILADSQETLDWAMRRAEELRREIALELLGRELEPGEAFCHVHVTVSELDAGSTSPGNAYRSHRIWVTAPVRNLDATLAHELCHVVLADLRLPLWLNEGIASRYDDPQRKAQRAELWSQWDSSWPTEEQVKAMDRIAPGDQRAYTVAEKLVERMGRDELRRLLEQPEKDLRRFHPPVK